MTKSLPKWCPKPPPGHLNLKLSPNCKSNRNNCIHYVLGTSRHRILVPCPLPNHKKNHSGIHTAIGWSKLRTSRQNDSKVGPKGLPKSIKNLLKPVLANEREARFLFLKSTRPIGANRSEWEPIGANRRQQEQEEPLGANRRQ